MNLNSVFIALRSNSFICKKAGDFDAAVLRFEDIENMPNVPFYHHIWDDFEKYKKLFSEFYKYQLQSDSPLARVVKSPFFIAMPDDALVVDRKIAEEFFMLCGARKTYVVSENILLSEQYNTYAAVSRTSRMIVLSYMKNGKAVDKRYLDRNSSPEELSSRINKLLDGREYGKLPVFLTGEEIGPYSELGAAVTPEEMLNNYISMAGQIKL